MSWKERMRKIDAELVADHLENTLSRWQVPYEDVIWAIRHGAAKPNDKRSKKLMQAAQYGASRLVPYEGDWMAKGSSKILDAVNILEKRLVNSGS